MAALTELFRRWLGDQPAEGPAPSHAGVQGQGPDPLSAFAIPNDAAFTRFTDRLQELLTSRSSLAYSQINMVGLDNLREKLGERWPKIKDKIHAAAEKIIRSQLSSLDVYVHYSDCEYLLVFGGVSSDTARLKCAKIADEICAYCMGHPDTAAVSVKTAVGRVNDKLMFEELKVANLVDNLAAVADKVELPLSDPVPATRPAVPSGIKPAVIKNVRTGAGACGPAAQSSSPTPAAPIGNTVPPARSGHGNPWDAPHLGPPDEPRRIAPGTNSPIRRRRSPAPSMPGKDGDLWAVVDHLPAFDGASRCGETMLSFAYRPIWDVKSKLLSTYQCIPVRLFPGYGRRFGYAVLDDPLDAHAIARLDLENYKEALCILDELQRNRFQIFIAATVHFETLATPKFRDVYLEIGHRVPARLRKFTVFDLVHLPEGVPQIRLAKLVGALAPFGSAVLARVSLPCKMVTNYADTGLHAIGIDLRQVSMPESEMFSKISHFIVAAGQVKLWTYIRSVRSSSIAVMAYSEGVRYMDGERLGALAEVPMHIHQYKWEDLWLNDGQASGAPA